MSRKLMAYALMLLSGVVLGVVLGIVLKWQWESGRSPILPEALRGKFVIVFERERKMEESYAAARSYADMAAASRLVNDKAGSDKFSEISKRLYAGSEEGLAFQRWNLLRGGCQPGAVGSGP